MKTIEVGFKNLDLKEYRNRSAREEDFERLIDEDATITLNGKKLIVYIAKLEKRLPRLVDALKRVKYDTSTRTNGLVTTSKIFGFAPRNVIRNHPCRAAKFASDQPQEHDLVAQAAYIAEEEYRKHHPEMADRHFQIADTKDLQDWGMSVLSAFAESEQVVDPKVTSDDIKKSKLLAIAIIAYDDISDLDRITDVYNLDAITLTPEMKESIVNSGKGYVFK